MATLVPVSLGGTGSNNITGAIDNLGISDSNVSTNLNNVNMSIVTIEGLTLNDATGVPTFINSNLYMTQGTRINGSPVLDSPILNNATISTGGLTFDTDNGNAFVTTARMIFGNIYDNANAFHSAIDFPGSYAVAEDEGQMYVAHSELWHKVYQTNAALIPSSGLFDFGETLNVASAVSIGDNNAKILHVHMGGDIKFPRNVYIRDELVVGANPDESANTRADGTLRVLVEPGEEPKVIVGPGNIDRDDLFRIMQINGNVKINGNLTIQGATLTQDIAAGRVQTNLHHYASTTNTTINSLIFGVDLANTNIDTVQGNLHVVGSYSNSRINIIQGNVHALGSYSNTRFSSVHSDISSNVNLVQSNLHTLGSYANTIFSAIHSDLTSNINTVQDNVSAIHSGSQNFTVDKTFEQGVLVKGDFTVQGSTFTADTTNLLVQDPLIILANNQSSPASYDAGLLVYRPSVANQAWIWDETIDGWSAISTNDDGSSSGSITGISWQDIYARDVLPQRDLKSPNVFVTGQTSGRVVYTTTSGELVTDADLAFDGTTLTAQTVDINGGSIDGVAIGTTTPLSELAVDNLNLNGNQISSTDTDGNIVLEPNGAGKVDVGSQLTADSLNVEDLTSGRVVYTGTSGELQDDGDFTFNGTTVTINTVDINGGAIDGTNIGATSQGTGNFTSLESDSLSVTNATASTSKDTGAIIITQGGLGVEGAIHAGGDVEAFNTSDSRLKENVVPIASALDKLDSINGVEFDWNASEAGLNYSHLGGHDVGVIAQDLQEILPEAVKERDDGYLAVDYGRVVPLLIQAIKELKAKIEEK